MRAKEWLRLWAALMLAPFLFSAHAQEQSGDGITYEEHVRVFPPAPVAVRAEIRAGKPLVSWEKPQAADASQGLAYDPVIIGYRVYRMGPDNEQALIGETAETSFEDSDAPAGSTRRYAVTAVQRSGHESELSAEATAVVP